MKCTKIKFEVHLRKGRTAALPGECPAWSIAFSQQGRKILDKWPASAVEELQNAYGHSHNRERTLERKSLRVGLSKVETKHNNLESWMAARLNFFFSLSLGIPTERNQIWTACEPQSFNQTGPRLSQATRAGTLNDYWGKKRLGGRPPRELAREIGTRPTLMRPFRRVREEMGHATGWPGP